MLVIEMNNNIRTVQGESSGVKLTKFQIEGWLELIGMPFCINQIVPGYVVYHLI